MSHSPTSTSNWRCWLSQLPLPLLVTFVDCLLVEGPKVKFRFALGFLLMLKSTGFIEEISNQSLIDLHKAQTIVQNPKFDKNKMLSKAFGIKRLSWNTCKTLISRHLVLLDISSGQFHQICSCFKNRFCHVHFLILKLSKFVIENDL